jgi:hypothetical protein
VESIRAKVGDIGSTDQADSALRRAQRGFMKVKEEVCKMNNAFNGFHAKDANEFLYPRNSDRKSRKEISNKVKMLSDIIFLNNFKINGKLKSVGGWLVHERCEPQDWLARGVAICDKTNQTVGLLGALSGYFLGKQKVTRSAAGK